MQVSSSDIGEERPTSAPAIERPVFAAPSRRRRRLLRAAGVGAAALAAVWLIALALGAFGFDAMPGITLPGEPERADAPAGEVAGVHESGARTGTGKHRGADAATRVSRAIAASAHTRSAATAHRRAAGTNRQSAHRGGRSSRSSSTSAGTRSGSSQAGSGRGSTPAATPASPPAQPSAGATTSQGSGRGRPASPGVRRSPTAGTGGNSGTTTATPTTSTTTESPGRSGTAPGHTR